MSDQPGESAINRLPKVVLVLGPTASGKSDVAIAIARAHSGEIVSADSRQVYRGLDIGTGKVTAEERALARITCWTWPRSVSRSR